MNRSDLERAASEVVGDRQQGRAVVDALVAAMRKALAKGERVYIHEVGVLRSVPVEPRMARNPSTGERFKAKRTARGTFSLSDDLKEAVASGKPLKS